MSIHYLVIWFPISCSSNLPIKYQELDEFHLRCGPFNYAYHTAFNVWILGGPTSKHMLSKHILPNPGGGIECVCKSQYYIDVSVS